MSYLVLARKYRPNNFEEVVGQEHITDLLAKTIASGRIAHAYLFCGPRGIGKTSCARILAKCLNCQDGPTLTPCGKCSACKEISGSNSFDVIEIDGASNRGIDEVRTIRENVKFAPSYGRYKIYIVDEVHMLTLEAFNALLKTLEEPPAHVKFIFATTDPNKLPATILSRCQRFDFKHIPLKLTAESLAHIAKKEKFQIDQDALYAIAKAARGSFRDALSILDQISAPGEHDIKSRDVYSMLGIVEMELVFELSGALAQKDCCCALKIFDRIIGDGKDVKQLGKDLIDHFRNLMIIKVGGKSLGKLIDYPVDVKETYLEQSKAFLLKDILRAIELLIEAQETARVTETFRTPLEIAFAKLTYHPGMEVQAQAQAPAPAASQEMCADEAERKFSATDILKNQKGQVNAPVDPGPGDAPDALEETEEPEPVCGQVVETPSTEPAAFDLEAVRKMWDALTYAVSREKMFIATYLQEGFPLRLEKDKLVIAFKPEKSFFKESLETKGYILLVERIFSEQLKADVRIAYVFDEEIKPTAHDEKSPNVKAVLDAFGGKIVSKWHHE